MHWGCTAPCTVPTVFRARRIIPLLLLAVVVVAVVAIVVATSSASPPAVLQTSATQSLRVAGSKLVYGSDDAVVQMRGINRSGPEYECVQAKAKDAGIFNGPRTDEPDTSAMIDEMVDWNINVVRIPLNEGCWLGDGGAPAAHSGAVYRRAIEAEVAALNAHHLFVVLALQWNAPSTYYAVSPLPMADADHSPAFWRSVASTFKGDGLLMFDLYNEPHGISWSCWLNGCEVPKSKYNPQYAYRAAGMQSLVSAVRSTGARQPLIVSGNNWALDISQFARYEPTDPDHALAVAVHTYGGESPCDSSCEDVDAAVARKFPVIYTEVGEVDCSHDYLDSTLPFLDKHGIGYLAWAWNAVTASTNGWTCANGPALISNFGGTPTPYGVGYRSHLQSLPTPVRP
jgi:endoglucanase